MPKVDTARERRYLNRTFNGRKTNNFGSYMLNLYIFNTPSFE